MKRLWFGWGWGRGESAVPVSSNGQTTQFVYDGDPLRCTPRASRQPRAATLPRWQQDGVLERLDGDRHRRAVAHADAHANLDADQYTDQYSDGHTDQHTHGDADEQPYGDKHTGGDIVASYNGGPYGNVAVTSKVYIAGGSGSTSVGARWDGYSGGVPTQGYNAELLSGGLVKLWRIDNWSLLGSYQIAGYSNGTWYTLTLRANGSSLSVEVNGVTRITATDSAFSSGEAGLWSYQSTAVSQHRFDDFVITVLGGGGAPGGRLYAPEQGTGLFARLSGLIREVANRMRNVPLAAPMKARLSAPPVGQTWKTYYFAGGQLIAMRVLTSTGDALYYLHSDHLGSTSLTTDSSGNVTARQNYYPFGQIRPGGVGTMPTDIAFTGQRLDATGLMHYGARYYSSALGRFVSADTLVPQPGNPQALNRFTYVLNNPIRLTDPTGHRCIEDDDDCGQPARLRQLARRIYGITFTGEMWGYDEMVAVVNAASSIDQRLGRVVAADASRSARIAAKTGAPGDDYRRLGMFNSSGVGDVFRAVFGALEFYHDPNVGIDANGELYWADTFIPTITVYDNAFSDGYTGLIASQNVAHELGHAFAQRAGGQPYNDLQDTWNNDPNFPRSLPHSRASKHQQICGEIALGNSLGWARTRDVERDSAAPVVTITAPDSAFTTGEAGNPTSSLQLPTSNI